MSTINTNEMLNQALQQAYVQPLPSKNGPQRAEGMKAVGNVDTISLVNSQFHITTADGGKYAVNMPLPPTIEKPKNSPEPDVLMSVSSTVGGNTQTDSSTANVTAFMIIMLLSEISELEGKQSFAKTKESLMASLSKSFQGISEEKQAATKDLIAGIISGAGQMLAGTMQLKGSIGVPDDTSKTVSTKLDNGGDEIDDGRVFDPIDDEELEAGDEINANQPKNKTKESVTTSNERGKAHMMKHQALSELVKGLSEMGASGVKKEASNKQIEAKTAAAVAEALKSLMQNNQTTMKSFMELMQAVAALIQQMGSAGSSAISSASTIIGA